MAVSNKIKNFMDQGSWIRRMFEEGIELKQRYGEDNVFDLSLGNPVLDPPAEFFDELNSLAESELKRANEFVLPGMCKLVVQNRKARQGRNPATGETIQIPAKTVVKARIAKQLKDSVLPGKK